MTTNFDTMSDDDFRRAAAILQHAGRRDSDGIQAVIEEALAAHRLTHLIYAQGLFSQTLFPTLASEYGVGCINSFIASMVAGGGDD